MFRNGGAERPLIGRQAGDLPMADDRQIEEKFWSELKDSPFVMLGIEGEREGATQPMTANFEDQDREAGRLWFFTANDHDFTRAMGRSDQGLAAFSAKGHGLFASLRGKLTIDNDRATIDRLWNPIVAEWYEGKDDPKLALVRFDVADAKIWLSDIGGFLKPAFNKLFGRKPEAVMEDKVAEISL
jgi:general stress protein 26